ncbi:MAG: ATP-binding cassette domain-containing protein [Alphaproteobacteria bacterium]|nr:ATP-binding cassette domain-containing protein [Alphaproteobacteria bacterium]
MIEVRDLTRRFGSILAVDHISFSVTRGEVLGFLGPNGAGKSTTMKMITGFLAPTDGTAVVCGADIVADSIGAKRRIGYLPEGAPAYPDMSPRSFLRFIAEIRGFAGDEARRRIDLAVARTALVSVMEQPIETLSKGFKRRVGLAQALLHDPDVLILDEPTDGLDPNQKHEVRTLIKALAPEKVIVISTHLLEEVEAVCTRAIIIAAGRLLADATPVELAARSRLHNAVRVNLADGHDEAETALRRLPGVVAVERVVDLEGGALLVLPRGGRPIVGEVTDLVRTAGWAVRGLSVERGRLDEVFRTITA